MTITEPTFSPEEFDYDFWKDAAKRDGWDDLAEILDQFLNGRANNGLLL